MTTMNKPNTHYVGFVYDSYTPQVESQILKDIISFQATMGNRQKDTELVAVSSHDHMDKLLTVLGIRRTPALKLAKLWMQYKALDGDWPEVPDTARLVYQRNLYQRIRLPHIDPKEHASYYLPEPGRVVPDIISLLRPTPNAFAYPGGMDINL